MATRTKKCSLAASPNGGLSPVIHQWPASTSDAHDGFHPVQAGEIQIWSIDTALDTPCLEEWERVLSPDEHERANTFKVMEPRRQFVVARGLLRILLGRQLDVAPRDLQFGLRERGKPFLKSSPRARDLRFSISHTRGLVVIALTLGCELGVDVECLQRQMDWRAVAERFFSSREFQTLQALPDSQQPEAFFRGWTRKEAYLKATGEGLIDALHEIEVTLAPGEEPRLLAVPRGGDHTRKWAVHNLSLPLDYVGSLVVEL